MKEPIIHRLMREMEDGSFIEVGHMKIENGKIYQRKSREYEKFPHLSKLQLKTYSWKQLPLVNIEFDRIDRFTGVTLNDEAKTKVFERDIIEYEIDDSGLWGIGQSDFKKNTETIRSRPMFDTEYVTGGPDGCTKLINIKIVGIEGVHKTEERGKA